MGMKTTKSYTLKNGRVITAADIRKLEKKGYSDAEIARRLHVIPQTICNMRKRLRCLKKYPTTIGAKSGRPHGYREFCESNLLAYKKYVNEKLLTPFIRCIYHNIKEQRGW